MQIYHIDVSTYPNNDNDGGGRGSAPPAPSSELASVFDYKPLFFDRNFSKEITFFKKEDPSFCTNYQPISLLSNLSKKIETFVHKRVSIFLTERNTLYEKQFGFRKNRSTMHALT